LVAILVVQGLVMSLFRQHQLLEKPEIFSKTK
jgi:hypothetical protein